MYTYQESLEASIKYFDGDELAAKVFVDKYALRDNEDNLLELTPDDMHRRLAKEFARIEKKKFKEPLSEDFIFSKLEKFKRIIPQGSPMYGIGNIYKYISISNCTLAEKPLDSYSSIMKTDEQLVQLSKRRCGVGIDISNLRPCDAPVSNSARTSSGITSFMERYSNSIREVGQCICEGERVLTENGLKPIEEITVGEKVWTKSGWVRVINVYSNGIKPIYELTSDFGYKIKVSNQHIFLNEEMQEVALQNLEVNDKIVIIPGNHKFIKPYVQLNSILFVRSAYNNSNRLIEHQLPTVLDEELAYFLGYSYGDGCIDNNSISLACSHDYPEIENKLLRIIKSKFNYDAKLSKGDGAVNVVAIFSKYIVQWLKENCIAKGKSANLVFPEKIKNSPSSVQAAFCSGYFDADGTAKSNKKGYSVTSIDYDFIHEYQNIIMSLGIPSKEHFQKSKIQNWKDKWSIAVTGTYAKTLFKEIFSESVKIKLANFTSNIDKLLTPYKAKQLNITRKKEINYCAGEPYYLSCNTIKRLRDDGYQTPEILVQDSVRNIEYIGERETFDLELESEHLFYCEGFYVHNSGRRGALMISIDVTHPEVEKFIDIKNDPNKVTGANISVKLTDEFLSAVKNNSEFTHRWPINSNKPTVTKTIKARDLWKKIIYSAWNRAEPGLLFWDTILSESVANCYADFGYGDVGTNPCSEIPLSELDSCRLLVINLLTYVKNPFTEKAEFNYEEFIKDAKIAQRLMDDIVDLEAESINKIIDKIKLDPEPEDVKHVELTMWEKMLSNCINGRRTGSGLTAIGDTLAALNIKYCSDESLEIVDKIYKTYKLACYTSSVDIAEELGAFPVWSYDKEKNNPFLLRIKEEDPKLYARMKKYGRRNIALLTSAPVGSVSLLTKTTSGIEPLFMMSHIRRKKIVGNDNRKVDYIDNMGDKWENFTVYHPTIKLWMDITGNKDETQSPWYKSCAADLDWRNRVLLQSKAQQHIDHSISSCLVDGESYIQTSDGLLDISEISQFGNESEFLDINKEILSINSSLEKSKITKTFNNGVKPTLKISTDKGNYIACTEHHKLMTLDKEYNLVWIEAKDIQKDTVLVGIKSTGLWPNTYHTTIEGLIGKKYDYKRISNSKDITIPKYLTKDFCRLIGYIMSDGSIGPNSVSLCQLKNNVCDDFISLMKSIFNLDCTINRDKRSNKELLNIVANSREVCRFLLWMGLPKSHNDNVVPLVIRKAPKTYLAEYLKGLTLDGHVSKENLCLCSTTSYKFASQLQKILMNYNIMSSLLKTKDANYTKFPFDRTCFTQEAYTVTICGTRDCERFVSEIGFAEERKISELSSKFKRTYRIKLGGEIPDYGIRKHFRENILPKIRSSYIYERFMVQTKSRLENMWLSRETLNEMIDLGINVPSHLTDDKFYYYNVTNVENYGYKKTSDISVPNGNSYIANGFISHNTINLPQDVTEEQVAEIYETAWETGIIKGITVYRDGCRSGVLVSTEQKEEKPKNKITKTDAPTRPESIKCDIYHITIKGVRYFVIVGLLENDPYEIFISRNCNSEGETIISKQITNGVLTKKRRGHYNIVDSNGNTVTEIVSTNCDEHEEAIARLVSTALRHGADINFIVHQLEKTRGDMQSFSKAIARTLKKYILDGTKVKGETCQNCSGQLVRTSGCIECVNCGWSKC